MRRDLKIEISRNRRDFFIYYAFYAESSDRNLVGGMVIGGEMAIGGIHLLEKCRDICYSYADYDIELINSKISPVKKNLFNRLARKINSFKKL